ncbi:MAG: hypothetical protein WCL50_13005, partial [Spirochaetota bacterium]
VFRGPASIIQAEADGRAAARAVMDKAGIAYRSTRYAPPPPDGKALAGRGDLASSLQPGDPGFLRREAERCLACDSACERCVEVCPNRAYFIVPPNPGERMAQILQIDSLCNECGNCGSFCPWDGEPWKDKPALFRDAAALEASAKAGFSVAKDRSLRFRAAPGQASVALDFDAWFSFAGQASHEGERMLDLARTVLRDHSYLLGEAIGEKS